MGRTTFAIIASLVLGAACLPRDASAEVRLVMVEEEGCVWCARWEAEVGDAYPKTDAGRAAPIRRVDITRPIPDDLDLVSPPRLTPTFILVEDGTEHARIEGYPGEDFFWPMVERMLTEADLWGPDQQDAGRPATVDADP
ncbi:hypothetical protein LVO79_08545 [Roseivivax marinus]|uniref:hypothetical protein n=1 Tax=Roseivivax marinus TaxID=1379903 RepID=UPI001F04A37C|nr:hypothetical protein [Roseivivax marinus]UMA66474.1 hypothetical protein LVO79_08545 [Roseivivax marinus]